MSLLYVKSRQDHPLAVVVTALLPNSQRTLIRGPMAQDFRAAFGLGACDTEIVTIDADGVALAAIQGLNAKLEDEVVTLRAELAQIRALLAERLSRVDAQAAQIAP
jgi:trimeric autotransporter adhesin